MINWPDDPKTPALVAQYKAKGIHIVEKKGWFWETLSWLLYIFTFTGIKRDYFMYRFATTIGTLVAFPKEWEYSSLEFVMPHEARHVWQGKACGLFISTWVGLPIFAIFYLLLPLPLGFSWFRYLFEKDATRATVLGMHKDGESIENCYALAERSARRVSSAAYGWAFPEKLALQGYRKMVQKVFKEKK